MEAIMALLHQRARLICAALFLTAGFAGSASATHPGRDGRFEHRHEHEWHYARYHHDRYYPVHGTFVDIMPPHAVVVAYGGLRFYFSAGVWYRPEGPRFVVIAPPVGVYVPVLPPYYSTVYVRGVPYYYANDVYYAPSGQGYVVVNPPPPNAVVESPPPSAVPPTAVPPATAPSTTASADTVFVYPRQGQSAEQQAADRYACHQWAVSQVGADPTTGAALPPQKRADYQRALSACLDGRGYTVR
jgi:hypothetical protein